MRHFLGRMSREPVCLDPDDPIGVFPGPSDAEACHAPERWRETVSAEAVSHLRREGWCVIDGFLSGPRGGGRSGADDAGPAEAGSPVKDGESRDRDWASSLRDEIAWLSSVGLLTPNRTHFANHAGERYLFSKPHVFEADMHDCDVRRRVPLLKRFFEDTKRFLPDAFARAEEEAERKHRTRGMATTEGACEESGEASISENEASEKVFPFPRVTNLARGDEARVVKLQHNKGFGGCFPSHYDNPGGASQRLLTCILYLNCDWKKGDGGELCLTPFLKRNVKVKPLHDRLCAFYADRVLHRVEPSFVERFCLTVWLDGEPGFVNTPEDVTLRLPKSVLQNPDAVADHLRYSATQRSLSRAVYREVYESSLVKCMKDAPGCAEMLASHEAAVQAVARNEPLSALVEALRERKAFAEMGGEEEV